MSFSIDTELNRLFRLKCQIYTEPNLSTFFNKINLSRTDLIITSNFLREKIQSTHLTHSIHIINIDDYGKGEPKEDWVNLILEQANSYPYERIIAIGGGATLDIAKLCVFGDGKNVQELFDNKLFLQKKRELIALPTTCGTGSEVTNVSVVEFPFLKSKLGLQIDALFPDKAILIGDLLCSLPYKTFVLTSIDALAHAIESLLSPKANAYTDMYARSAIEGIIENLIEIQSENRLPKNIEKSLICANMAGIAFSIAGCATMHALSFPLGSNYNLAHGEAVYAVFAKTLEYYKYKKISIIKLEKILNHIFENQNGISDLLKLLNKIYPCPSFNKMGITEDICVEMAQSVFQNQQRLLVNSPSPLTIDDLSLIYKNCIE